MYCLLLTCTHQPRLAWQDDNIAMSNSPPKKPRISLRISMTASLIGAVLITSFLLGGIVYTIWRQYLRADLATRMHDLVATSVLMVDPAVHGRLRSAQDMQTAGYQVQRAKLKKVRQGSPDIRFLYTFRWSAEQNKPVFVLDTGTPGVDFSPLGEVYDTMTPTLAASFTPPYQVRVADAFYTDQYGTWLSSYAPIIAPDGSLEGVLGLDMDASRIIRMENQLLLLVLGLTLGIIALMGALSFALARQIAKPLQALCKDMGQIQQLKLETPVNVRSNISEVLQMYQALENMKMGLRSFRKYVPSDLVSQLIGLQKEAVLGTNKQQLTIFFCDLENFTAASEALSSEDLSLLLSSYFEKISSILQSHGATIDKFIGDAVMAFWNAPLPEPDHPYRAAKASLEILQAMEQLRADWHARGLPALSMRIGLNTGPVLVGNVGHNDRFSYTALGDAVNVASRLESLNKHYGTRVLVSQTTLSCIEGRIAYRVVDCVAVKGKSQGARIAEIALERPNWWVDFDLARQAYERQDWAGALQLFNLVHQRKGSADRVSVVLAERCQQFLIHGVPPDWDGVWVMQDK